ncbi:MAG: hypothetical protein ACI861_001552 [Paracoccaceae bacterium]
MDWYAGVIEVIDMRSFTSIWYWIVVAVVWSSTAHWTMGVPYDAVSRARKSALAHEENSAQEDLETLVRVNCNRIVHIMDVTGPWIVGLAFFLLTILALLGFWYKIEIAQAVFLLAAPMTLVALLSVRNARIIRSVGFLGEALRRHLGRQRFFNQVIGMISIFITAFWGMWHNLNATVL